MPAAIGFKARLRRRWRWIAAVALILVIVGVAPAAIGSIIRARLAADLHQKYGVDLQASWAFYVPPWGVSLRKVRVTQVQPDGTRLELLTASRLLLKLEHYPSKGRPVIVTRLVMDSPSLTIASHHATKVRPADATKVSPAPQENHDSSKPAEAPAEKLEIRHMEISDGRVYYKAQGREPFVLEHINLAMSPAGDSSQLYQFSVAADHGSVNQFKGAGSINTDGPVVGISDLSVRAKVGAILSEIPLSEPLGAMLPGSKADGMLEIHGTASLPLRDWERVAYDIDVRVQSASAQLPQSHLQIQKAEAEFHLHGASGASAMQITCPKFLAVAGGTQLLVDDFLFQTTADGQSWRLTGLRGRLDVAGGVPAFDQQHLSGRFVFTGGANGPMEIPKDVSALSVVQHELIIDPRDAAIQPWSFPIPVDHINGGPISFRGGVVRFENLHGNYGGDRALLDKAHITLDDPRQRIHIEDLQRSIRIEGIQGTLICKQPGPAYPAGMQQTMAQLHASGPFAIGGGSWYAINRPLPGETIKPKPDYFFRISSATGAFALTDHRAPLTSIHGDAILSPMLINITNLRGDFCGGTLIATGKVTPIHPIQYDANATFYNINLETAQRQLAIEQNKPVAGQMYLQVHASGSGAGGPLPPKKTFSADGEFEVVEGNFGDVKTIRAAAGKVTKPDQQLDGSAAGLFDIRKEVVTLNNCAVGNPLFGLLGMGTIGFDQKLDLHVSAAPLGDWREALKKSQVPVLDKVGGDIAGAIQQLFSGAQRVLLYDIHVGGTTTAPVVEVTPAPAITAPVAALFGQLLGGETDHHLIEKVRIAKEQSHRAKK